MLTEILVTFGTRRNAQRALTAFRKKYRVALRGAVVINHDTTRHWYRIHAPLGGTGFSAAEMASALNALDSEVNGQGCAGM